jgi:hypothetical protein
MYLHIVFLEFFETIFFVFLNELTGAQEPKPLFGWLNLYMFDVDSDGIYHENVYFVFNLLMYYFLGTGVSFRCGWLGS